MDGQSELLQELCSAGFIGVVPSVAVLQNRLAEEEREVFVDLPAIRLNRRLRPLAFEPQLAPRANIPIAAAMRGAEHRVELRQRQTFERVVLVHENHMRIVEEIGLEASGRDVDAGWRIALGALECLLRARADLLSEDGEVPRAGE